MPYITYRRIRFRAQTEDVLDQAEAILAEYRQQGYELTLRQLYYQFVARALIPNTDREYKKLGDIISDGRYAGRIDWNEISDRTRHTRGFSAWDDPAAMIEDAASDYQVDLWEGQPNHVEVWVEKDALVGVIARACNRDRIPYMSCRGYVSASQMWRSAMKFANRIRAGRDVHVLHLGDHDPSGIDMSRDIEERLAEFIDGHNLDTDMLHVHRIALNRDQVTRYNPPPNPAKVSDSRSASYIAQHGTSSWELDALEPNVINTLIQTEASALIDSTLMDERREQEASDKEILQLASDQWEEIKIFLGA